LVEAAFKAAAAPAASAKNDYIRKLLGGNHDTERKGTPAAREEDSLVKGLNTASIIYSSGSKTPFVENTKGRAISLPPRGVQGRHSR
jgi:hypothetical protein